MYLHAHDTHTHTQCECYEWQHLGDKPWGQNQRWQKAVILFACNNKQALCLVCIAKSTGATWSHSSAGHLILACTCIKLLQLRQRRKVVLHAVYDFITVQPTACAYSHLIAQKALALLALKLLLSYFIFSCIFFESPLSNFRASIRLDTLVGNPPFL